MRNILKAGLGVVVLVSMLLAGCTKGAEVWDTTPIPTNAPVSVVVPNP